jgi:hypothetical protein
MPRRAGLVEAAARGHERRLLEAFGFAATNAAREIAHRRDE